MSDRTPAPIRYRVSIDPRAHELHVEMEVPALPGRPTAELVFPVWAPGSYMVRDFVRHVYGLRVEDRDGKPLPTERLDKARWRVATGSRAFRVRWRVFAFEATVRTSHVDDSHAYWNGTSVFFQVAGETARPCLVEVTPPAGWQVSTALPRRGRAFAAAGYDELVDSPFEVGTHRQLAFRVGRTTFEVALYGAHNAEPRRLQDILRRISAAAGEIFGGFPFTRYLWIVHMLPAGSGGLEHHASVTMDVNALSFDDEKGYQRFAELAAHELFHAWNVKRLHDPALGPFDYTRENYTRLLWFHEGFTQYMGEWLPLRAGLLGPDQFLAALGEDWPRYAGRPGRNVTPVDELSFEAWIKQYKPADNHHNAMVSYYEKGKWIALGLDLELRRRSGGRRGLPELFRRLWQRAGRREAAITERDVRDAARAIAGASLDAFFERYVHRLDELPVPAWLRRAGLTVREPHAWEAASTGKKGEAARLAARRARAWTGIIAAPASSGRDAAFTPAVIKSVLPKSPAFDAGLTYGDELIAFGGQRVSCATFSRRVGDHQPGERLEVAFFRSERLRTALLTLAPDPERRLQLEQPKAPPAAARKLLDGWLVR